MNGEQEAEPKHLTNMKPGTIKKAKMTIVDKIFFAVVKEKSLFVLEQEGIFIPLRFHGVKF